MPWSHGWNRGGGRHGSDGSIPAPRVSGELFLASPSTKLCPALDVDAPPNQEGEEGFS